MQNLFVDDFSIVHSMDMRQDRSNVLSRGRSVGVSLDASALCAFSVVGTHLVVVS